VLENEIRKPPVGFLIPMNAVVLAVLYFSSKVVVEVEGVETGLVRRLTGVRVSVEHVETEDSVEELDALEHEAAADGLGDRQRGRPDDERGGLEDVFEHAEEPREVCFVLVERVRSVPENKVGIGQ